ncbi:MAG: transposase [Methanosarcinaceae archaeon]|nr:transposase [Methanosarcinaceae archaeon]
MKIKVKFEDLRGTLKNIKHSKLFKYSMNSWSFYQPQTFIEYKAKMIEVHVIYIEPVYTSQMCRKCGLIEDRNGKKFKYSNYGHFENSDVDSSFISMTEI